MSTRFLKHSNPVLGLRGVPSGYEGFRGSQSLSLPSCGIEDIDRALFILFKDEIPLNVTTSDGVKKVPVIVAGGEKWALLKNRKGVRDENGSLILPLVTIVKKEIIQSINGDIAGRGSNQHTGEILIKKRLSSRDREYQRLLNKLFLKGQSSVSVGEDDGPIDDQIITNREVGTLSNDPTIIDGGYLASDLRNNIFEVIAVPTPQYITLKYEVTLWTQQQKQMNELIESIISSYMPQIRGWRIESQKGYWFVANVSSDNFSSQDNTDDMTKNERVVKRTFEIDIPAFILASNTPGAPVPIKRYISNPVISFGINISEVSSLDESIDGNVVTEPFLGSDDPTLPLSNNSRRRDSRDIKDIRNKVSRNVLSETDPANASIKRGRRKSKWRRVLFQDNFGNRVEKFIRIKSYNSHTGEMVLDGNDFDLGGLTIVSIDD